MSAGDQRPETGAHLVIDTAIYSVSAIMRAAYKFTDRCAVSLEGHGEDRSSVSVTLTPKRSPDQTSLRELTDAFMNELLDQRLRELLEAEFGPVRELIVAHAFADANLLDANRDEGDYATDPLGIGRDAVSSRHPASTEPPDRE